MHIEMVCGICEQSAIANTPEEAKEFAERHEVHGRFDDGA